MAKGPELPSVLVVISASGRSPNRIISHESSKREPEGHQGSGPPGWGILQGLGLFSQPAFRSCDKQGDLTLSANAAHFSHPASLQ